MFQRVFNGRKKKKTKLVKTWVEKLPFQRKKTKRNPEQLRSRKTLSFSAHWLGKIANQNKMHFEQHHSRKSSKCFSSVASPSEWMKTKMHFKQHLSPQFLKFLRSVFLCFWFENSFWRSCGFLSLTSWWWTKMKGKKAIEYQSRLWSERIRSMNFAVLKVS